MKVGEVLHGFELKYSQPLAEINAVLHRFTYVKNGADTVWLERNDDNKSFMITFRTVPTDETGVFHILEHSVLNGSEKYPLREPFVELIKSSLATFLNAMTASDMTMYPVSSRNDKDFLNLIDVYMDAVLHPVSLKDPHSFRQEGWHYELDAPDGELSVNGVVFNEMKGAYTSSDELIRDNLNRLLFPDTCYGQDSGGNPEHIPELTYEQYKASHRRYYHPSNSYIFLDGKVDLDAVLEKLDGFLMDYDKIEPDSEIALQKPVAPAEVTEYYPIGAEDDDENKALLGKGWVYGTAGEIKKNMAVGVLNDALAGSNESPLCKALLDLNLCEDVSLERSMGGLQSGVKLILKNCDPSKKDLIWQKVDEVFREQAKGLDHKRLMSVISHLEFLNREKDFGGLPTGLVYGLTAMDGWLYGLDPALTLCRDEYYQPLRNMVEAGEYEKLLREIYLDGEHRASIVMLPSKTVADEKREKEKQRLQALKDNWTNEQVQRVIDDFRLLRERQNTPDTPEQLATLPRLGISDIPAARKPLPMQISEVAGRPLVYEDVDSSGISYVSLNFDVDDLTDDELSRLSLLSTLYGNIETENFGVTELENEMDEKLGRFSVYTQVHSGKKRFMPLLTVRFAVLDGFKQAAVELIKEIMCHSKFADEKYILNLVRQQRIEAEQTIMMSGSSFAARHAASGLNELGAVREAINGIRFLRLMQNEDKHFSAESLKWMEQLSRKVLSRDRLTLNLTGKRDDEWLKQLAQIFPCTPKGSKTEHAHIDSAADGYLIPSEISFAACVGKLNASDGGTAKVASQILTYDYLWNTIRVKGGAYGTSFKISDSGTMEITSYRDPSAVASLKSFARCGEELKAFAASGESPDRFIVSTIGNIDPLRTPRTLGSEADWMYFTGTTQKDLDEEWTQVLTCDKEKLARLSAMIDDALNGANVCVIGGKTCLDKCEGVIKHTESIQ